MNGEPANAYSPVGFPKGSWSDMVIDCMLAFASLYDCWLGGKYPRSKSWNDGLGDRVCDGLLMLAVALVEFSYRTGGSTGLDRG